MAILMDLELKITKKSLSTTSSIILKQAIMKTRTSGKAYTLSIRAIAAEEWKSSIRLEVKLDCNVEINELVFHDGSCQTTIKGLKKNVEKAVKLLDSKLQV